MSKVSIIGLGLIGSQRVEAVDRLGHEVVATFDPGLEGRSSTSSLVELLQVESDLVVIAVPHDAAIPIAHQVLASGMRVLIEKPLGRSLSEFTTFLEAHRDNTDQIFVGLNYPYFQGVNCLLDDVRSEAFGELLQIKLRMGHGGSPRDKDSWKLDPIKAGGGCLLDPGIHLLDLICLFLGNVPRVVGQHSASKFWNTGVEEQALCIMESDSVPQILLDISIANWKSEFRLEVIGSEGYGIVDGRGRSYGIQRYTRGTRWSWQNGRSQAENETTVLETSCQDSFDLELQDILESKLLSYAGNSLSRMRNAHLLLNEIRCSTVLES